MEIDKNSIKQSFIVNINVIEGRHYTIRNAHTYVIVKMDDWVKFTGLQKFTENPYYDQSFTFELFCSMNELLTKIITFTVLKPRTIFNTRMLIGRATIDAALIMAQPEHMVFCKWLILRLRAKTGGMINRGFLKVSIGISYEGQPARFPESTDEHMESDNIERNLLVPLGMEDAESTLAILMFNIYRASGIPKTRSTCTNTWRGRHTHVQVTFGGNCGRTRTAKRSETPIWNEQIRILDVFPPLSQRISIELRDDELTRQVLAQRFINLRDISHDEEKATLKTVSVRSTPPLNEDDYFRKVPVLLYCSVFHVDCILSRYKNKQISFQIDFGDGQTATEKNQLVTWSTPVFSHGHNNFCVYDDKKPAMFITTILPDVRHRIYNSNLLAEIAETLAQDLAEIEQVFRIDRYSRVLMVLLPMAVDRLQELCQQYLEVNAESKTKFVTKLDQYRENHCLETIKGIIKEASTIPRNTFSKRLYRKVQYFLTIVEDIVEDIQESWPQIFIWICHGSKRVGYHRTAARKVCFSEQSERKGKLCGILHDIYFLPIGTPYDYTYNTPTPLIARARVFIWCGLQNEKLNCFKSFPKGAQLPKNQKPDMRLPTFLSYTKKHVNIQHTYFQMKCYIYQGRIIPGIGNQCLINGYVRISFRHYSIETKVIKNTLNPTWNQTLILSDIYFYEDLELVKLFMPELLVEVYDLDKLNYSCEIHARGVLKPKLRLLNGKYLNNMEPKLNWIDLKSGREIAGEILMEAELIEINPSQVQNSEDSVIDEIPQKILPKKISYRIEVMFWGLREIRDTMCMLKKILRPRITIAVSNQELHSSVLPNAFKFLNFFEPFKYIDVEMPEDIDFAPPISIEFFEVGVFGKVHFVAINTYNANQFFVPLFLRKEYEKRKMQKTDLVFREDRQVQKKLKELKKSRQRKRKVSFFKRLRNCLNIFRLFTVCRCPQTRKKQKRNKLLKSTPEIKQSEQKPLNFWGQTSETELTYSVLCDDIDANLTWWSKFLVATERRAARIIGKHRIAELKVFNSELENQKQYDGFFDFMRMFKLYCGRRTGDPLLDEKHVICKFKGAIKIYQLPSPADHEKNEYVTAEGFNINNFILRNKASRNEPEKILVRLYIIRAFQLRIKNIGSGTDPYLKVLLGNRVIYNGLKEYQQDDDDSVFACKIEEEAQFPEDYSLTIQVWDKGVCKLDRFIGETKIDIENRYYSKHRARCGIAKDYCESGYNAWRDTEKPSKILARLCRKYNVAGPVYYPDKVTVGPLQFVNDFPDAKTYSPQLLKERLSLKALHNWYQVPFVGFYLVPEHVETRSLYHHSIPNLEKGKIQLWVDMFPMTKTFIPPPVDITPQKPISYELRVIVWNTEEVILVDNLPFTGIKSTDIYVRGWITDHSESQVTDVHYHSLTGEGNFNWRFVFRFDYLPVENQIIIKKRVSRFASMKTIKIPCKLTLQVWDNDTILPDDFLGSINLELARCPKGAQTPRACTLKIAQIDAPVINLFKIGRARGWWPFLNYDKKTSKVILTGKVELEIEILTIEEALQKPVGLGRDGPHELPPPKRPDTSFSWLHNPILAIHFLCRIYCQRCFCCLGIIAVGIFICLIVYSLPGNIVKKLLHVY